MSTDSLQFRLPDQLRSAVASRWWPHTGLLRRALALALFTLAIALALLPAEASAGPPRAHGPTLGPHIAGPGQVAVPVRLAEPAIAQLLHPGMQVDLVTAGSTADGLPDETGAEPSRPRVLATAATVLALHADPGKAASGDQLVVLALPARDAADVAASALRQRLTVTLL